MGDCVQQYGLQESYNFITKTLLFKYIENFTPQELKNFR